MTKPRAHSKLPFAAPIQSPALESVAYDPAKRELWVIFHNSASYLYHQVPLEIVEALLNSPAPMRYLSANIRDIYPFERNS